jgi:hypothetical protein
MCGVVSTAADSRRPFRKEKEIFILLLRGWL